MLEYNRSDRVGALLQRELSDIIHRSLKDPRVSFCTVGHVEVSSDLKYADVLVSVVGDNKQKQATLAGLRSASGFLRREVGNRIDLRFTPELRFALDKSADHLMKIDRLLKQVQQETEEDGPVTTGE